ncbi:MAG: PIN domain-containing protein [Methanomassiliicoccaceae archaeon]|nr:PIN domain-containing protein [Methanomassiliicoccaceae archaeon]
MPAPCSQYCTERWTDKVVAVLDSAERGEVTVAMNKLNLMEVYYGTYRSCGKDNADRMLSSLKTAPISVKQEITDDIFFEASRLKVSYKISLADSIALAEASTSGGELLTADHHEFDIVEKNEKIKFCWIR